MERGIFAYILAHSLRQQVAVVLLTVASLPFYYVSLDLPKRIVNQAIGWPAEKFPRQMVLFGHEIVSLGQLELLFALCGLFLTLVLINGAFKYAINVYKGLLGERMLRRLRYQLFQRLVRFPPRRFRRVSQGEIVAIIASEVEPLGGFIGDALATPLYQGGLLATAFVFIMAQDWIMGLAVVALYPFQAAVIPRLQAQVNRLGKARVQEMRAVSNAITEAIAMTREMRLEGAERHALARFAARLGRVFEIRYQIYRKKFFIKFLNNFLAQVTPFFFFLVGGYLVIRGQLSLGALVAVIAAYKDLAPPWKDLLDYYQSQQDARIRYEQILAQFDTPSGDAPASPPPPPAEPPRYALSARAVGFKDDGAALLHDVTFALAPGEHVAILGDGRSGKDALAHLLAGLETPSAGEVRIEGVATDRLSAAALAATVGFVDGAPAFQTGTVLDNVLLGLRRRPDRPSADQRALVEASASGNTDEDPTADWIDYQAAGVADLGQLIERTLALAEVAALREDLFDFGLRARIDPATSPELAARLLAARRRFAAELDSEMLAGLVERFDPAAFNAHLSVAENIAFSEPGGPGGDLPRMLDDREIRRVFAETGLEHDLLRIGHRLAVAAGRPDTPPLPVLGEERARLRILAGLAERDGPERLPRGDRRHLESLALRVVAARDRAVEVDEAARARIVETRQRLAADMPASLAAALHPFDPAAYNASLTLRENVIFGEVDDDVPGAAERIALALREILAGLDIEDDVRRAGLGFDVGAAGARLAPAQRQKLAILRALVKRPRILVLADATVDLDPETEAEVIDGLRATLAGRALVCLTGARAVAGRFERILRLAGGRITGEERGASEPVPGLAGSG